MLSGKLALVTGAGSGIGRAACQILAREGAQVIASDFNEKTAQETVSLLPAGKDHMSLILDVSIAPDVQSAIQKIISHYSVPPCILVNSAGILRDSFILKMTSEMFQQVIDVNLKGTFNVTQSVCQALVEAKKPGSIVNIASISGRIGNMGQCNYAASKAGVEGLTKTAAREMGVHNIRCNAVVPGFIKSPMTDGVPEKVREKFRVQIPLARFGDPEEVAEVIAFLASDKSSYINGACIPITGGY